MKGEVSKNVLSVVEISVDCDGDSPHQGQAFGPDLPHGDYSCFGEEKNVELFSDLFSVIEDRRRTRRNSCHRVPLQGRGECDIAKGGGGGA